MVVISTERSKISSSPLSTPSSNQINHNNINQNLESTAQSSPSTSSIHRFIQQLQTDYPEFTIKTGSRFKFRPPRTIILNPKETYLDPQTGQNQPLPLQFFALFSLHELGHALCRHKDYNTSIERLKIESQAWQMAKTVVQNHPEYQKKFGINYDQNFAEAQLDTYRDWLHNKSKCPRCGLTRFQTPDHLWHCPLCNS